MYAFAILDELIPLYPVYALLFADSGLSTGQISTLLVLWSLTGFLLEVPTGVLADRLSRRRLLTVAALLRAAGFALWLAVPSYAGFAVGFVLWGMKSAFSSGTWEALIYDELAAAGETERYPRVIGRAEVLGVLGVLGGTAAATPLMAAGGYGLTGWLSVAACVAGAVVAVTLPERTRVRAPAPSPAEAGVAGLCGYLETLWTGLREARSSRTIRRLLVVAALLPGLSALDEYLPLLARSTGASDTLVPILLLVQYAGLALGAELGGRFPKVAPSRVAALTAAGGLLLAAGALSGHPIGFLGVGACFAALWYGTVVSGTRLQERMTGRARATVTSLSGLATETVALAVYGGFGIGVRWASLQVLVAGLTVPLLLLAGVLPRWLPAARDENDE